MRKSGRPAAVVMVFACQGGRRPAHPPVASALPRHEVARGVSVGPCQKHVKSSGNPAGGKPGERPSGGGGLRAVETAGTGERRAHLYWVT